MHYFRFNVGDYLAKASHLTPVKHGVYLLLTLWYYHHEKPIPESLAVEIGRAPEVVVRAVLDEFFSKRAAGWWHGGIESAIAEFKVKSAKSSKAGKLSRERVSQRTLSFRSANAQPTTNQEPRATEEQEPKASAVDKADSGREHVEELDEFTVGTTKAERADRKRRACPLKRIVAVYHEMLPELPAIEEMTTKRASAIRQRWINSLPEEADWRRFFTYVRRSDFLMGRMPPGPGRSKVFRANLEWLTTHSNFAKIKEGKYHG